VTASGYPDDGPARVLVVLDRPELVELVTRTLNHGVCTVRTVTTMQQVATIAAEWQPHLLILDMALNGLRIMQQIRTRAIPGFPLSVIGLVCRGDLRSKLAAFDACVDDILTIPFAPEELLARVGALMRRFRTASIAVTPAITVGQLEIDVLSRSVRAGGSELHLTPLELGLLYLLAANPGRVLTREEILDTLWGTDHGAETNVVDQHVRSLRARLQTDGRQPRFIATVAGRGYRFLPSGQTG
jgi:two-component system response regulator MtrA